jgi:hypothetical protein
MNKKYFLFVIIFCFSFFFIVNADTAIVPNPLPYDTLKELFDKILEGLLYLVGGIFVLMIVISGVKLMTAMGDPGELQKAKNTIWYCSLGLIVLLAADAIYNFVSKIVPPL